MGKMSQKFDPRKVLAVGRLVVVLLALAVVGVGCIPAIGPAPIWKRTTYLRVWIHDVTKAHMAGYVRVTTSGMIVPFPPIKPFAFTETRACNLIGDAVAKFLSGEEPSEHADVSVVRAEPTQIESHDAITVVLDQFGEEFSSAKERKFASCITRAFHEAHPTVRIVPPEEFHQVVPAFNRVQVGGPAFREQIAPLGIRYLIFMYVYTATRYWP